MDTLYLIASLGGQRVAFRADHIDSVVEIDRVTPAPCVARHVAGLAALRSRVMTVIDTLAALDLGAIRPLHGAQVVTVMQDGHLYGLLVDAVEDVVALVDAVRPVRATLAGGWGRATQGLIEHEGDALLLLDPAALIAGPAAAAA